MIPLRAFVSFALACLIASVTAGPASDAPGQVKRAPCAQIQVRKEWRDLTTAEKADYIRSVKCLQALPPRDKKRPIVTSRFEEFQATHIDLTERVHQVGHFLPWHRQLLSLYGKALREECGYTGPVTHWDWSKDADSSKPMRDAPVFDPVTGFGGDGVAGTYTVPSDPAGTSAIFPWAYRGCVATGPFNATRVHLGPGKLITEHCLVRGIDEGQKNALTSTNVANVMKETTFESFRNSLEMGRGFSMSIHGGGHGVVGGEMINPYSSPADPLFYLHHGNLDRIWWNWQKVDPANRMFAVSGPTTQRPPFTQVTLDFVMDFPGVGPNITVREIMDSSTEPGCFTY